MREIIEKAINEGIKKQLAVEIEEIVKQIETEAEIMKAEIERYNESTTKIEKISVKDTIKIHEPQIIEFESKLQIKKTIKKTFRKAWQLRKVFLTNNTVFCKNLNDDIR